MTQDLLSERILSTPPSFIRSILKTASDPEIISFAGGLPNPISFPQKELAQSAQRIVERYGSKVFQYSITAGLEELRDEIARRYNALYGLDLRAEHVLITTGSQQALDLIGKALLNAGDGVILEKPSYLGAIQAFSQYGPQFYSVELTDEGMDPEGLRQTLTRHTAKVMYAIPNFQNPTGLTYTADNRARIRDVLRQYPDLVLVEDDPYGELRFDGAPLPYIGAGELGNSILLGSFSKTITPGMRLGYLITQNTELLRYISIAKEATDLHTNVYAQYLILDYLQNNDYQAHMDRIKALYRDQAQTMLQAMAECFPADVRYTRPHGGMFIWATLPHGVSAMQLFPRALQKKVAFVPGDPFYIGQKDVNTMRLNYTNADSETIREGIRRLGDLLRGLSGARGSGAASGAVDKPDRAR